MMNDNGLLDGLNTLPAQWMPTTIGAIYRVIGGGTPSTSHEEYWGGDIPWITSADIKGVRRLNISRYVTDKGIQQSATNKVPPRTLLVVTRVGLGKIAISDGPICFSQDLQGLVQDPNLILPEYALYYLSFALERLKFEGRGTTISGLTKKQLKDTLFPLAPFKEQIRIVAKIEELFSELDKGVENLETTRQQLKVYRQAVLKHAFEGKLTEQWREENRDKLKSADQLFVLIRNERKTHYRQQLDNWEHALKAWEENGKHGKRPLKPRPLRQPPQVAVAETRDLCALPSSWLWIRPEDLASPTPYSIGIGPFGSNLKVSDYRDSGVPLIFVRNITNADFANDLKYIGSEKAAELQAHTVEPLDIVITKMGDPPGDCAIYPDGSDAAVLTADCLKFRLWADYADRRFYKYCILSNLVKKQLGLITRGVAQKKISVDRFKTLALPMPPLEEQRQIADLLSETLSRIDQLECDIDQELSKCDALRQSILKKAFSGQLVSQDPTDEPASILLERIKDDKARTVPPSDNGTHNSRRTNARKRTTVV